MPKIMKIRQCFLELQLKMSGMFFFETHCTIFVPTSTKAVGVNIETITITNKKNKNYEKN